MADNEFSFATICNPEEFPAAIEFCRLMATFGIARAVFTEKHRDLAELFEQQQQVGYKARRAESNAK